MIKIFLIIFLCQSIICGQQIKRTEKNVLVKITDTRGIYEIGLDSAAINKSDIELLAIAQQRYAAIKIEEASPPKFSYIDLRRKAYPPLADQLDMIYWDMKNGTKKWIELIDSIKTKYPKN